MRLVQNLLTRTSRSASTGSVPPAAIYAAIYKERSLPSPKCPPFPAWVTACFTHSTEVDHLRCFSDAEQTGVTRCNVYQELIIRIYQ